MGKFVTLYINIYIDIQLAFEQYGLELCGSTYTQIFSHLCYPNTSKPTLPLSTPQPTQREDKDEDFYDDPLPLNE